MNISVFSGNHLQKYSRIQYPDGTLNLRFETPELFAGSVRIKASIKNHEDVWMLGLMVNAIRNIKLMPITLLQYFCYYSQADRCFWEGSAYGLEVYANYINSLQFKEVVVVDAHSDKTTQFIQRCTNITAAEVLKSGMNWNEEYLKSTTIVCPDKGAYERAWNVYKTLGFAGFVKADKVRNEDGEIVSVTFPEDYDCYDKQFLIVDDCVLAGGSVLPLIKGLLNKGAVAVDAYFTHAILNKGVDHLYEAGLRTLITTDSYTTLPETDSFVKIIL